MPTAEEIRALDGPGLTKLAWELGLAPQAVQWHDQKNGFRERLLWEREVPWRPHVCLTQADVVFRGLRARGWTTSVAWFADDRQHGDVFAATQGRAVGVHWPRDVPTEAMALLLCAVLARASEGDTHDDP